MRITCALAEPPPAVRAAAWFVVSEAVTNAAKHPGAADVAIDVHPLLILDRRLAQAPGPRCAFLTPPQE
ncbi:hypothetical protein PA7_07260 [Pseudonocardia asaccharolytica DSM 44247 = NBRC 16224]|uniref:Histidine kinase/HSP90-like ATPase domain-containing protein n=1 Tax=Pseudonocardia asaccharolytica DSM 44247 = NBRC 16224 TaxID=1123024 RepID=A0A511CWE3_9PSEU|nr:hypothetical protein PA7_07260 [Pseudonocardia asaccharolytica DSM 44247 = NBRC 16224]